MRAQRAYQQYGLKPAERPTIQRVNAVCAEPMPGDAALLAEFSATLTLPVLGQLLRGVFERMRLAGEAGSLLRIEADLREEILLQAARPTVVADLGYGVLDTAMVETAAYCLERV